VVGFDSAERLNGSLCSLKSVLYSPGPPALWRWPPNAARLKPEPDPTLSRLCLKTFLRRRKNLLPKKAFSALVSSRSSTEVRPKAARPTHPSRTTPPKLRPQRRKLKALLRRLLSRAFNNSLNCFAQAQSNSVVGWELRPMNRRCENKNALRVFVRAP